MFYSKEIIGKLHNQIKEDYKRMDDIRTAHLANQIAELVETIARQDAIIQQYEQDRQALVVILDQLQKGIK